jgi:hypothetical protein
LLPQGTPATGPAQATVGAGGGAIRYMDEEKPSLTDVAQVAALLAERSLLMCGR